MRLQLGLIPRLQWMRFLCQIPEDYIFVSMQPLLYHDGLKKHSQTRRCRIILSVSCVCPVLKGSLAPCPT